MSFASILVYVEADPLAEPRLRLAASLANEFDAFLVGVGAEIFEPPNTAAAFGYVDGETMVAEANVVQHDLRFAEARFTEVAKAVGGGSSWRSGVGLPYEIVVQQSRAADLIVCGPRNADRWGLHNHADAGDVLMSAGRPLLVTPPDLSKLDASSIVIAWKDTRESRRAVSDAMPLLKRASQVLIAEVCETSEEVDAKARCADVAEFLARHGVKASTAIRRADRESAMAALLQIADMQDAGLIGRGAMATRGCANGASAVSRGNSSPARRGRCCLVTSPGVEVFSRLGLFP